MAPKFKAKESLRHESSDGDLRFWCITNPPHYGVKENNDNDKMDCIFRQFFLPKLFPSQKIFPVRATKCKYFFFALLSWLVMRCVLFLSHRAEFSGTGAL